MRHPNLPLATSHQVVRKFNCSSEKCYERIVSSTWPSRRLRFGAITGLNVPLRCIGTSRSNVPRDSRAVAGPGRGGRSPMICDSTSIARSSTDLVVFANNPPGPSIRVPEASAIRWRRSNSLLSGSQIRDYQNWPNLSCIDDEICPIMAATTTNMPTANGNAGGTDL